MFQILEHLWYMKLKSVQDENLYCKCSKISNTFLILFSKMLIYRTVIHKMCVRIANREDPDQTASSEAV